MPEQPNSHLDHSVVLKIVVLFHGSKSVEVKRILSKFNFQTNLRVDSKLDKFIKLGKYSLEIL